MPEPVQPVVEMPPSVVCIIVNWNGWQDTLACLDSLAKQDYPALRVLVVDNHSSNDSVLRIRTAWPGVELIEAEGNLGFAGGNNLGLRRGLTLGADFVWLLNNDTLVPQDTCSRLVAKALGTPGAGIIGSVIRSMNEAAKVQAWGGGEIVPWLGRSSHYTAPVELNRRSYLTFASVLIRREVFEKAGLMDDGYFMYFEDADFCLRSMAAGFSLAVADDTAILHKEGASDRSRRSTNTDRYATASGLYFLRKHAPVPLFSQCVYLSLRMGKRLVRGRFSHAKAVLQGAVDSLRKR